MAARIAVEYDVPYETLDNLITSESSWNPNATSTTGDYGLVQINLASHPSVAKDQALDPVFALRFAAKALKDDKADMWVACNCFQFSKVLVGPLEWPVRANSAPTVGSIAIFDYKGVPHFGVVQELKVDGFTIRESNFEPCKIGKRFIGWNDSALRGFHTP